MYLWVLPGLQNSYRLRLPENGDMYVGDVFQEYALAFFRLQKKILNPQSEICSGVDIIIAGMFNFMALKKPLFGSTAGSGVEIFCSDVETS